MSPPEIASSPEAPPLDEELAAFIGQGRISVVLGSCDASLQSSVAFGLGCRVSPDRRRVTVVVSALRAAACIADVRATARIAVNFALPSTNRSVQLKGRDAIAEPARTFDLACVARHTEEFVEELMPLRELSEEVLRTLLQHSPEELVAISFTPCDGFVQTPGPEAGERL